MNKLYKKLFSFLFVSVLVLVGGFSALVPKTNAAATIAVSSALITGPNKITIVFIPVNIVMLTAPITAFGAGALALTSGGTRSITNLDSLTVNTAVYTFDGAPVAGDETASLTVTTPTLITDTASANTFNATLSPLSIGDGQGQVPTVSSIITGDSNGVGTIDRLVLTFSEDISGTTNGTGFTVAGSSCTLGSASETTPGVMTFILAGCTAGTAVLPTLTYTYTPGNLVDAETGLNSVGAFGPTLATDNAAPILDADNVLVDNSVQPNKVTLTFSEPLEITAAQTVGNYIVRNRDGLITYTIASAVLSPSNTVTLTLATVNPADNKTFVTNNDIINNPITVIPSASITDATTPPNSYVEGLVNDFGEGNLDSTKATVNATLVRTDATTYKVTFSEKLDLTTAQTLNKYTLGGTCLASTGNPSTAVLQANGVDVVLTTPDTSGCAGGQTVIVTPAGTITDVAGMAITSSAAVGAIATSIVVPTLITEDTATEIKRTTATISGAIIDLGGENAIERGLKYGLTLDYENYTNETDSFGATEFSANLIDLKCGKTYHFESYASNSAGTGYGPDQTFATLACAHSSSGSYLPGYGSKIISLTPLIPISCPIYGSIQELVKEKTRGVNAKGVQNAINQLKATTLPLATDGIIGYLSEAGIKNAQKILFVTIDGIWGPKTQQAYELFIKKQCSTF